MEFSPARLSLFLLHSSVLNKCWPAASQRQMTCHVPSPPVGPASFMAPRPLTHFRRLVLNPVGDGGGGRAVVYSPLPHIAGRHRRLCRTGASGRRSRVRAPVGEQGLTFRQCFSWPGFPLGGGRPPLHLRSLIGIPAAGMNPGRPARPPELNCPKRRRIFRKN